MYLLVAKALHSIVMRIGGKSTLVIKEFISHQQILF